MNEKINDLTSTISSLIAQKRQVESERAVYHAEVEESATLAKTYEDKLKKTTTENTKLLEDLKKEQVEILIF